MWSRRTFMQAAGLGGAGLLLPKWARAQESRPAPRLLFVFTTLGPEIKHFRMKPLDAPDSVLAASSYDPQFDRAADERGWEIFLGGLGASDFSYALEPLHRHREKMLVLDGMSLLTTALDQFGDEHAQGYAAAATGNPSAFGTSAIESHASRASVDKRIASYLRSQDTSLTDLTSINVAVANWCTGALVNNQHTFNYDEDATGAVVRVPVDRDPRVVFNRLFAAGVPEGDVIAAKQTDLLGFLAERYGMARPRFSADDRRKLDIHRDLLVSLADRLESRGTLTCTQPVIGACSPSWDEMQRTEHNLASMKELVTAAFACGISRVATLQLPYPQYNLIGGDPAEDAHQFYSHESYPVHEFSSNPTEYANWSAAHAVHRQATRWYMSQLAELADAFAAIPEPGGTMLDNTMIVWLDEISHGGHGHDQYPSVILGGGGDFRLGRYVRFPRANPIPWRRSWGPQFAGEPHTKLLVSLCQAMGMPLDHLGVPSVVGRVQAGAQAGLTKSIALGGRLEALY
jgi:hypothetical protein